jgi:serine/threonine protein kinase
MIGELVSHYRIVGKIGQGGMGEVFLADDTSLHRKVALKFLPPALQQDAAARKRFLREAHSAAALDHPFICHINEVADAGGRDVIVMEYVEGQSLKDRLEQGALSPGEALPIAIEVAEALETAHSKGIVHRDIKPGNIMLTRTGHAKVMDFGLAKQVASAGGRAAGGVECGARGDGGAVGGVAVPADPSSVADGCGRDDPRARYRCHAARGVRRGRPADASCGRRGGPGAHRAPGCPPLCQRQRRRGTGLPERRPHHRNDRPARPDAPGELAGHRTHDGDALQED